MASLGVSGNLNKMKKEVRYTNILYRVIETSFTLFKSQFEAKFRLPCLGKKQR